MPIDQNSLFGRKKQGREVSSPVRTGPRKGEKRDGVGYNSWVRTAGGEKNNSFLVQTLSKLRFLVLHNPSTLSTSRNI
jgi:hypothetical protein